MPRFGLGSAIMVLIYAALVIITLGTQTAHDISQGKVLCEHHIITDYFGNNSVDNRNCRVQQ
jgi:hypothetical protein